MCGPADAGVLANTVEASVGSTSINREWLGSTVAMSTATPFPIVDATWTCNETRQNVRKESHGVRKKTVGVVMVVVAALAVLVLAWRLKKGENWSDRITGMKSRHCRCSQFSVSIHIYIYACGIDTADLVGTGSAHYN